MIDLNARNKAAELLRHFAAGRVSNFDFEDQFPNSDDPAIIAIESSIWCFYDDFEEGRMSGKYSLSTEQKKIISRWVVFLYTDEPYNWPFIAYPGVRPLNHGTLSKLFGKEKKEKVFMSNGDYDVWPFFKHENYLAAKEKPRLLSGS